MSHKVFRLGEVPSKASEESIYFLGCQLTIQLLFFFLNKQTNKCCIGLEKPKRR